ncbi:MAG TPA: AI-2E family transporter [Ktedonobacteraceae bacterium]|nr:AI-2E family transporter [Ktedonobacteraceae bacterium]
MIDPRHNRMERVNWQRVRDILIVIICIGIVVWAAFSIMGIFVHAIVLLLLAMAVAFLVTPLVNFLDRYMPRLFASLIVYLLVVSGLIALCYALVFSLIQQVNYFSTHLPVYVQNLPTTYTVTLDWLVKQGIPISSINKAISTIEDQANALALTLAANLVSIVQIVADVIVNILLVAVLSFYLTLDGKRIRNALVNIAPKRSMPHVMLFEDSLNRVVGNYIRGQLTLALIIGVLAGVGCYFLGLNNFALIIGVLAFIFETIPMVGPALASIPAILISLLLPDPFPRTYVILIYFIIIQLIESNILGPRIVGHAVGLHPVASILALIVGVQLFGPFGALLATPILAAVWVVVTSFYRSFRGESADEMLANKRTSWIRRSSQQNHLNVGSGNTSSEEERKIEITPPHMDSSSHFGTINQQIEGHSTSGRIELIDLLRSVPVFEDKASSSTQKLTEIEHEE